MKILPKCSLSAYRKRGIILLGQAPGEIDAELGSDPITPGPPNVLPLDLPSDLLKQRPDVRAAERRLAAATARIGAAQADWYPRFSLLGDAGFASSILGEPARRRQSHLEYWPLAVMADPARRPDRSHHLSARRPAAGGADCLSSGHPITALKNVEDALAEYTHERAQRARLAAAFAAERERVALEQSRFAGGLSDFRSVLIARQALSEAQRALSRRDFALATDWIAIHKALGGDWNDAAQESDSGKTAGCADGSAQGGLKCTVSR